MCSFPLNQGVEEVDFLDFTAFAPIFFRGKGSLMGSFGGVFVGQENP